MNVTIIGIAVVKHYVRFPLDHGYGSHQPVLLAVSILTAGGGPVMELGCGYFSTILLHDINVVRQKRYLLSTDTDLKWLSRFESNMSSSLHKFRYVNKKTDRSYIRTERSRWSIALVDHKPGDRRTTDLIRLENITDVVILHDTETRSYKYEEGLAQYPYKYRYTYLSTNTDILNQHKAILLSYIRISNLIFTFQREVFVYYSFTLTSPMLDKK